MDEIFTMATRVWGGGGRDENAKRHCVVCGFYSRVLIREIIVLEFTFLGDLVGMS